METEIEITDAGKVSDALECVARGDSSAAEAILRDVCSRCPDEYVREFTADGVRVIKFWDFAEFLDFCTVENSGPFKGQVLWSRAAYPPACFHLASLLVEKGSLAEAAQWLGKGSAMEPLNPNFPLELGYIHAVRKDHEKALSSYARASDLAAGSKTKKAAALRGMAVQLVDLGRLDAAEERIRESLQLEPENAKAKSELGYILLARAKASAELLKDNDRAAIPKSGGCLVLLVLFTMGLAARYT